MQETVQRAQQQARWLLWQMDGVTVEGAREATPTAYTTPQTIPVPDMRRARYDSVVRRMQQAGERTGTYTAWT